MSRERFRKQECREARERTNPISRNEAFVCHACGLEVERVRGGTCRDHCPACLWGLHVDEEVPGDRLSSCEGAFEPVAVETRAGGQLVIHFRCCRCGTFRINRAAEEDDPDRLVEFASRPLPRR